MRGKSAFDPVSEIVCTGPNVPPAGRVVPRTARVPATNSNQINATLPASSLASRGELAMPVVESRCGGPNDPYAGFTATSTWLVLPCWRVNAVTTVPSGAIATPPGWVAAPSARRVAGAQPPAACAAASWAATAAAVSRMATTSRRREGICELMPDEDARAGRLFHARRPTDRPGTVPGMPRSAPVDGFALAYDRHGLRRRRSCC